MSLITTDFPLVYRKLLPLGSPPITFETPLSIFGRLANTDSTKKKRKEKEASIYKNQNDLQHRLISYIAKVSTKTQIVHINEHF